MNKIRFLFDYVLDVFLIDYIWIKLNIPRYFEQQYEVSLLNSLIRYDGPNRHHIRYHLQLCWEFLVLD